MAKQSLTSRVLRALKGARQAVTENKARRGVLVFPRGVRVGRPQLPKPVQTRASPTWAPPTIVSSVDPNKPSKYSPEEVARARAAAKEIGPAMVKSLNQNVMSEPTVESLRALVKDRSKLPPRSPEVEASLADFHKKIGQSLVDNLNANVIRKHGKEEPK
jgi:hypothetical protein